MERCYTIICRTRFGNICNYMLEELNGRDDTRFVYQSNYDFSKMSPIVRKFAYKFSNFWWLIRKNVAFKQVRNGALHTVIVTNEAMCALHSADLQKLQQAGTRVVALLIDPISANYPSATAARELIKNFSFDKIITFDPRDAENHGWTYCNTLYSKFDVKKVPITKDLFYIANIKDRLHICKELLQLMEQNDVNGLLKLSCNQDQARELPAEVILREYLPYPKMLELLQSTKCIFDMTQQGQSGITLRYYEAVVFNKKLLTNNPNITRLPFYDPRYMKIYGSIADIDWQWVKGEDMPDYQYDGSFSPRKILDLLCQQ